MRYYYIGRFQPLHLGHMAIIRKVMEEMNDYDTFTIIIGSADQARSLRNPLSIEERETILKAALETIEIPLRKYVHIKTLNDSPFDYDDWVTNLRRLMVGDNIEELRNCTIVGYEGIDIYAQKMAVEYQTIRYDPVACMDLDCIEVIRPNIKIISPKETNINFHATDIRNNPEDYAKFVEPSTAKLLKEFNFPNIIKQIKDCGDNYVKSLTYDGLGPKYPSVFMTVDNVVLDNMKVLCIKRKDNGKYAIPGGFAEPTQFLKENALRELKEETGLVNVHPVGEPFIVDDPYRDPRCSDRVNLVSIVYTWTCNGIPNVIAGDDAAEVMWISKEQVEEMPASAFHADHKKIICRAAQWNYFKV